MNVSRLISSQGLVFVLGGLPVLAVAMHSMGFIHIVTSLMIIGFTFAFTFGLFSHTLNTKRILKFWLLGWVAVGVYDSSRIAFILAGWDDFIPGLGGWLTDTSENFWLGYLWRYAGNGGGLAVSFLMLSTLFNFKRNVFSGLLFGLGVFTCLETVLITSSQAQENMFPLCALTFCGGLIGHVLYGITLGWLADKLTD